MFQSLKFVAVCGLISLGLLMTSCGKEEPTIIVTPERPVEPMPETPTDPPSEMVEVIEGTIRDISSMEIVAEMGIGWNLGNSFDVRSKNKTAWGNPLSTGEHVKDVREMGFKTLRIPVTWDYDQEETAPYTIEPDYLSRIQKIVNEGLMNDMHVIINTHHDDWIIPTNTEAEEVTNRLSSLWTQVANHFKAYGDHLIFEVMNEPRLMNSPEEWSGGTQEGRDIVNALHKAGVEAIRATGGNNANRHIMVSTYAASSTTNAMRDLVVPNDDPNIIISVHSYFPWSFAGQEDGPDTWGTSQEKTALESELDRIRDRWMVQENRPVILGEWGTTDKNNLSTRTEYCAYYAKAATDRGLLPIVWDDGGKFGMYNRNAMTWKYPEIADAIVKAAE